MNERTMPRSFEKEKRDYGLVAKDFSLYRAGGLLIKDANFAIYPRRKVALIGRNGGGKTTLLETILAIHENGQLPEGVEIEGELKVSSSTRIGYLPQEVQLDCQGTVGEYLDSFSAGVADIYQRWEEAGKNLTDRSPTQALDEYNELTDQMTALEAWDYPRRKDMVLEGLGLPPFYLGRSLEEISGGEATLVALAAVLLSYPNLILLDEPTNNLDFKSMAFLERWIKDGGFSCFIISHDRRFLDRTIQEVLEIDEENSTISLFGGNYSFYSAKKKEIFSVQQRAYEEQKRKRRKLKETASALKQKARKYEGMSHSSFYRAKGAGLARRAKVQLRRVEKELSSLPEPKPPKKPKFIVRKADEKLSGELLMGASNIHFAYSGGEELVAGFSFSIKDGERVGIVGPCGVGKTTLLRLVLGEIKPKAGRVVVTGKIGYLPQQPAAVDRQQPVLDYFRNRVSVTEEDARQILGRVLFQDISQRRMGDFSAGQIRRIQISALFAGAPNIIILDEPTNYLDILTTEMLEEALVEFKGGVLVISHDERFLRNIMVGRVLKFKGRGEVSEQEVDPKGLSLEDLLMSCA